MRAFTVLFTILLTSWTIITVAAIPLAMPGRQSVAPINPSAPVPLVVLIKHPEENASTINEEAIQSSDIDETTVKSMKMDTDISSTDKHSLPGPPVPSGYTRYFVLFNVHKESKEAVTVLETLKELGGKLVTILSDADGAVIDLPPGVLSRAKVTQHVDEIIPVE